MKQKFEVLNKFKEYVNLLSNTTGKRVKVLRSDNGGEYCSGAFTEYLKQQGIRHQTTVPYSPAQNGLAERINRTLVETARSMMHHASVPTQFWAEATNTALYLKDRSPCVALKDKTPYQCMFNEKPDVSNLKVFGCTAFVHIPPRSRKKFVAKSKKMIFVGYPKGTKGYKLYDPARRHFIRSRDVIFAEGTLHDFEMPKGSSSGTHFMSPDILTDEGRNDNHGDTHTLDEETYEEKFTRNVATLPEKRQRRPPQRFTQEEADYCFTADVLTADIDEPKNINEAWNDKHSIEWKQATDSEFASLQSNETWDLVPMPKDKNIVGCHWVFKVKRNSDGSLDRFKARLVAQGFTQ